MANGRFDFGDLAPRSEIVVLPGGKRYRMHEASEGTAIRYRNATLASFRLVDGKASRIEGLADAEASLVADCLKGEDEQGNFVNPVLPEFVRQLHSRVVRPLFEWIKEASDLGEAEKDPDPELIAMARKELVRDYPPDVSPEFAAIAKGINLAIDWIKRHAKEREDARKNGQSGGTGTSSEPRALEGASTST